MLIGFPSLSVLSSRLFVNFLFASVRPLSAEESKTGGCTGTFYTYHQPTPFIYSFIHILTTVLLSRQIFCSAIALPFPSRFFSILVL